MIGLGMQELKDSIREISVKKRELDDLFSDLQGLFRGRVSKLPVAKIRVEFHQRIDKLKGVVKAQGQELQKLRYRAERLKSQGNDLQSTLRNLEALQEYFRELDRKLKEQQGKGEQEIAERERWEVAQHDQQGLEEQSQLIMSSNAAREVRESAEMVLGSLQNQGSRLQRSREKMSAVLKNINLSGNIVNLLKRRSRDDNKLIMWLTIGLVLQIFLCIYYIRPLLKGY